MDSHFDSASNLWQYCIWLSTERKSRLTKYRVQRGSVHFSLFRKLWYFSFLLHQNLTSGTFEMINYSVESQTISVNYFCSITLKFIGLSCTSYVFTYARVCKVMRWSIRKYWLTELYIYFTITLCNIRKRITCVNIATIII